WADRHHIVYSARPNPRARSSIFNPPKKMPVDYPKRSLLRCGLDICSISQSIHTKAMPRPTTTPKNSNVRPGAVSMVSIHELMQAAYQLRASKERPRCRIHQGRPNLPGLSGPQHQLTGPDVLPAVDRSEISRRPEGGDASRTVYARGAALRSSSHRNPW